MEYKYTQETVDWLKQQMATEKKRREYYQHIVYSVCNMLDQIDGRHPGNGIVCGTAEEQYNDIGAKIQQLTTELDSLRQQLTGAQEREATANTEIERLNAELSPLGLPAPFTVKEA